jgi:hypothetical protein
MYTNGLRLRDIEKKAALFDLPLNQAIGARRAFLQKEMDYYMNCECDYLTWKVICWPTIQSIKEEIRTLKMSLSFRNVKRYDDITDDMIQEARGCPVSSLIDFSKGQAQCLNPDHTDKHPSMYLAKRINKVICGSCNWKGDAIDVFMIINDVAFHQAVKSLCGVK